MYCYYKVVNVFQTFDHHLSIQWQCSFLNVNFPDVTFPSKYPQQFLQCALVLRTPEPPQPLHKNSPSLKPYEPKQNCPTLTIDFRFTRHGSVTDKFQLPDKCQLQLSCLKFKTTKQCYLSIHITFS